MDLDIKIYTAGHNGMVGSTIKRRLDKEGYTHLFTRSINQLYLRNEQAVKAHFDSEKTDVEADAATCEGGSLGNRSRTEFSESDFPWQLMHLFKTSRISTGSMKI